MKVCPTCARVYSSLGIQECCRDCDVPLVDTARPTDAWETMNLVFLDEERKQQRDRYFVAGLFAGIVSSVFAMWLAGGKGITSVVVVLASSLAFAAIGYGIARLRQADDEATRLAERRSSRASSPPRPMRRPTGSVA